MRLRIGVPLSLGLWLAIASIQTWTGTPASSYEWKRAEIRSWVLPN